jgi:hypothetical protein
MFVWLQAARGGAQGVCCADAAAGCPAEGPEGGQQAAGPRQAAAGEGHTQRRAGRGSGERVVCLLCQCLLLLM